MDWKNLFTPAWIGFAFCLWSIVSTFLRVEGGWAVTMVMVPTAITLVFNSNLETRTMPSVMVVIILVALGVFNGWAMCVYGQKIADRNIPTSIIVVGVAVMMIVWAALLDSVLNGAIPTPRQTTGFALALVVIYLLNS